MSGSEWASVTGYMSPTGYPNAVSEFNAKMTGHLSATSDILTRSSVDFLDTNYPADKGGYDIVGCRYDMKSNGQNYTKYGPPLSYCGTYNPNTTNACGTVFYPIN
jgi:hypothetical protein